MSNPSLNRAIGLALSAVRKINLSDALETDPDWQAGFVNAGAFRAALLDDNGHYFDRRLQDAGFTVLQAV